MGIICGNIMSEGQIKLLTSGTRRNSVVLILPFASGAVHEFLEQ